MMDLSEELIGRMQKEYSVSEISAQIKQLVESSFSFVRVKGEIFGAKKADSGHWYLSLKDENALLSAVCWRTIANSLQVKIEDGMEVIASGKITTFNGRSSYQMVIEHLEISGQGTLLKLLEERKQKFLAEGLFAAEHKKKIPYLPNTIGVVTSPTGAVIRDIIHRINDRFASRIIVWPTPVQGEDAAPKIAQAIKGFNDLPKNNPNRPDVLIVARGGGSLEDLWPFNDELVVRAVYNSEIPIISAVGHETDTMLIDYAADLRAPTPTGAAEFAVPVKNEIFSNLLTTDARMKNAVFRYLNELRQHLKDIQHSIVPLEQIVFENTQKLDDRFERLQSAFAHILSNKKIVLDACGIRKHLVQNIVQNKAEKLQNLAFRADNVSVQSVLNRGFAWVKNKNNKTIHTSKQAKLENKLKIYFADDFVEADVKNKNESLQWDLFS